MMTFLDSRKYNDLKNNPLVSLVIGFDYTTVQYEGIAFLLENPCEAMDAFLLKQTPCTSEYLNNYRARFFKIKPKWIRYSDYHHCPAEIFELNF